MLEAFLYYGLRKVNMFITDKRIGANFKIQLEVSNRLSYDAIEYWLVPFFCVQKENDFSLNCITKIKTVTNLDTDFMYNYNDDNFYVNADLQLNKLFYTIMSILRMLFKSIASLLGYQNLHAACLVYKDNGILIRAERNQGKTTMLLNALQDEDFSVLANDQVMYSLDCNKALGYPAAVGIRNSSCDTNMQKIINNKALWFIDDPFQEHQKPVVHIKDLSQIYQCKIQESANISILINYEKSMRKEEIIIEKIGQVEIPISCMLLPFEKTYNEYLLNACLYCVERHINSYSGIHPQYVCYNNRKILQLNVKCGLLKINEMLSEIKSFL